MQQQDRIASSTIIETTLKAAHAFKKGCTYITLWQTQKGITCDPFSAILLSMLQFKVDFR